MSKESIKLIIEVACDEFAHMRGLGFNTNMSEAAALEVAQRTAGNLGIGWSYTVSAAVDRALTIAYGPNYSTIQL